MPCVGRCLLSYCFSPHWPASPFTPTDPLLTLTRVLISRFEQYFYHRTRRISLCKVYIWLRSLSSLLSLFLALRERRLFIYERETRLQHYFENWSLIKSLSPFQHGPKPSAVIQRESMNCGWHRNFNSLHTAPRILFFLQVTKETAPEPIILPIPCSSSHPLFSRK